MTRPVLAGIAAVLVCASCLASGCSSPPPRHVSQPPPIVVPGVVSKGNARTEPSAPAPGYGGAPGRTSVSARVRRYGAAGSHGQVLLGGWAPGGVGNPVAAGAEAYFRWLNARGGVYGREVVYKILDDHGGASVVPSLAHQLVQGDAVFAVFGAAGTGADPVVTRFLNSSQVPDLFPQSVCACVDDPAQAPDVYGWPLEATREGKILGAYVAKRFPGLPIAVLDGADAAERTLVAGFKATSKDKAALDVEVTTPATAAAAVRQAKQARAKAVIVLAAPAITARVSVAMTSLGLRVPLIAADSGLAVGLPDGTVTDGYLPSLAAPAKSPAASWIALFRSIGKAYLPGRPLNAELIDGMASAYEMAAAMFQAGPDLTRDGLLLALSGIAPGPAVAPLGYSLTDHGGATGAYMGTLRHGVLVPAGSVFVVAPAINGLISAYSYPQQSAPVGGVPPL